MPKVTGQPADSSPILRAPSRVPPVLSTPWRVCDLQLECCTKLAGAGEGRMLGTVPSGSAL